MEQADTRQELEARLVRYRDLARQYFDVVSVGNMRLATAELEQQISDLDDLSGPLCCKHSPTVRQCEQNCTPGIVELSTGREPRSPQLTSVIFPLPSQDSHLTG